jgi:hypothetical protein
MFIQRERVVTVNYELKWSHIGLFKEVTRGDKKFMLAILKNGQMIVLTYQEFVALKFEWMRDTGQLKGVKECVLQL